MAACEVATCDLTSQASIDGLVAAVAQRYSQQVCAAPSGLSALTPAQGEAYLRCRWSRSSTMQASCRLVG